MRRIGLPMLLGGCLLLASAGWADDLGYIDCSKYPENTRVVAKAAKTEEVVTSLHCGERFTIVASGYFFTRIQTQDGKVGYVYTYLVSREDSASAGSPAPAASGRQPSAARPKPAARTGLFTSSAAPSAAEAKTATPRKAEATPVQATRAPAPEPNASAPTPANAAVVEAKPAPPTPPEPAAVQPTPAQAPAAAANATSPSAPAAEAEPTAPAQPEPQPTRTQPAAQAPRGRSAERGLGRIPSVRSEPLAELFGGYALARFSGSGYGSNINGGLGSFGWNARAWLQIVSDTSYGVATISGTRTVLYGNHFGPRIFRRPRNGAGLTPFGEVLFGASRIDSGSGIYKVSDNGFSIKGGGGLDWKISRHVTIRLLDADYYRISFLTASQNNYWVSSGIVLRFLGGRAQ